MSNKQHKHESREPAPKFEATITPEPVVELPPAAIEPVPEIAATAPEAPLAAPSGVEVIPTIPFRIEAKTHPHENRIYGEGAVIDVTPDEAARLEGEGIGHRV